MKVDLLPETAKTLPEFDVNVDKFSRVAPAAAAARFYISFRKIEPRAERSEEPVAFDFQVDFREEFFRNLRFTKVFCKVIDDCFFRDLLNVNTTTSRALEPEIPKLVPIDPVPKYDSMKVSMPAFSAVSNFAYISTTKN